MSYSFPPLLLPESIQASRQVKYLVRSGWRVDVLTVRPEWAKGVERDEGLLDSVSPGVRIERVASAESLHLRRVLARLAPSLLVMPDDRVGWYGFASRRAVMLARDRAYDLVYSRSSPYTSNLVGLAVKRRTALPWVAHFSDPWVDNPYAGYGPVGRRVNGWLEERVMRSADAVVFTCPEARERVEHRYGSRVRGRVVDLPNTFDPDLVGTGTKDPGGRGRLRLVYTGDFYGRRRAEPLIDAVGRVAEAHGSARGLDVVLAGGVSAEAGGIIRRRGLEDVVRVVGRVSYRESLSLMESADVLLVVDADADDGGLFLPSKLAEYLGTGKPILGLTPGAGPSARVLRAAGMPVVGPSDVGAISAALEDLIDRARCGRLERTEGCGVRDEFDARRVTARLLDVFDDVLGKRGPVGRVGPIPG